MVNLTMDENEDENHTQNCKVGSIKFLSSPSGAEIFIDDTDQGHITPYTITNIPIGTHNYRLKLKDHSDIMGTVAVQKNTISQISVDFTTGKISTVALIFGVGVVAILMLGIISALGESETTRTTVVINR